MKRYMINVLLWLDVGINVILFAGTPYETVSSRVGKRRDKGDKWACVFCRLMDKFDDRHCAKSKVPDIGQNAPNYWKV